MRRPNPASVLIVAISLLACAIAFLCLAYWPMLARLLPAPRAEVVILEGRAASGTTIDCGSGWFNGGRPTELIIRSRQTADGWERPENITIRNCRIRGSIRIMGMGRNGEGREVRKSSVREGHTRRAQEAAPMGILISGVEIEAHRGIPLYLAPGVTRVTFENSRLTGWSCSVGIYLDAESGDNVIRDNVFSLRVGREVIAVDGSANNRIERNVFERVSRGGIYLYRNCGEGGTVRHQTPHGNVIEGNRFDTRALGLRSHGIWLGSRNGRRLYCHQDDGYPFGSSADNRDFADDNAVIGNTFSPPSRRAIRDDGRRNQIRPPPGDAGLREVRPFEITVYGSSEQPRGYPARNVVNGKGMAGFLHDSLPQHSWRSLAENRPHPGTEPGVAWIKFRFDREKVLDEVRIWNENQSVENGVKDIILQASPDGERWQTISRTTVPKGRGEILNAASATIACGGMRAKEVILIAASKYGPGPVCQLGEVKFIVRDDGSPPVSSLAADLPPPALTLDPRRSIAIDRTYTRAVPPAPLFNVADIARIRSMGFDSVKIMINPYLHMEGSELTNTEFLRASIDTVVKNGLPCIACVHPPGTFKQDHFNDAAAFARLSAWYESLASFIAGHWTPDQVALQMMTEPSGASADPGAWNYFSALQHRMWASIRKGLPQAFTIILGGDEAGNLEALYFITPVPDPNVMYSFTHHRPHVFAFHGAAMSKDRHYDRIAGLSYPADPTTGAAQIEAITAGVAEAFREPVRREVATYHAVGWGYERQYELMKTLAEWNQFWGGKLRLICAEFGCVDNIGDDRYRFIADLRSAMEANGIGWIYWAYNRRFFTVYQPGKNRPFLGYNPGVVPGPGPAEKEPLDRRMLDALFGALGP